ncbi:MAG: hypothetical protein ACRDD2_02495 [Sarcina sp.]
MKKIFNVLITLIVIIVAIKLFVIALPILIAFIAIVAIGGWLYYRYAKRKILKKMNEYENGMNETHYYNTTINNSNSKKEEEEYTGPVIDVDYEDVNKD